MSTGGTVWDRLAQARRQRFVGRAVELDLFRSLVEGADPGAVLFVHGPGGVGKTALLGRFVDLAHELGVDAVRLDARTMEPSPPAFLKSLADALGLPDGAPLEALRAKGRHAVPRAAAFTAVEVVFRESLVSKVSYPVIAAGPRSGSCSAIQRRNWASDSSTYRATVRGERLAARTLRAHESISSSSVATRPPPLGHGGERRRGLQRTPMRCTDRFCSEKAL